MSCNILTKRIELKFQVGDLVTALTAIQAAQMTTIQGCPHQHGYKKMHVTY